jgi:hypothetical protein
MKIVVAFAGALLLAAPIAAHAANADHPYSNVDHRNDAGNNTGDSQVDRLNQAQLETNGSPGRILPPRGYAQPQAYYPGQVYYAPRGSYAPRSSYYGW